MIYLRKEPSTELSDLIDCFWIVDSEGDTTLFPQKIIPDGYPELVFHYGDLYKINISGKWEYQSKNLIAGQITRFFYLENTGVSGMIGVKMKPWAIYELFNMKMHSLVDQVKAIEELLPNLTFPKPGLETFDAFCDKVESLFLNQQVCESRVKQIVEIIHEKHGMLDLTYLSGEAGVGERQLERLFKTEIGLGPKFYARIVRLSYIFQQVEKGDYSWAQLAYLAGFTDQSHLIKNFKEFTAEDPSKYDFNNPDMANFFLKK